MEREHGNSFVAFVLAQSRRHRDTIMKVPFAPGVAERFARLADESRAKQREIEAGDTVPFEVYRQKYLDPARLDV
jgi:glutamate--cysteine ligase